MLSIDHYPLGLISPILHTCPQHTLRLSLVPFADDDVFYSMPST